MTHPLIAALKAKRTEYELTQQEIADRTGLSNTTISELEAGNHSPRLTSAQAYAGAVGLHVDILGGELDAEVLRDVLVDHRPLLIGRDACACTWYPDGGSGLTHADHVIGMWQFALWQAARLAGPVSVVPADSAGGEP